MKRIVDEETTTAPPHPGDVSPGGELFTGGEPFPGASVATWHARSGRLTERKRWALQELAARFAPELPDELHRHHRRAVLEIGAGTGEAALALAVAHPELLVIAAEVHRASLARLLLDLDELGIDNVRVVAGDGRATLATAASAAPGSLALLRAFFPDPWPKRRHHGRRLIDATFAGLAADALGPDGLLELATDDAHYAAAMASALRREHRLLPVMPPARAERPCTYYEARALQAGRTVADLRFRRATPTEESTPS